VLTTIQFPGRSVSVDLSKPIDISIPMHPGEAQVNAYQAPPFSASPVRAGDFVGSISEGGPVNFVDVKMNPHGNGTHTECVGHIGVGGETMIHCVERFFFMTQLITVTPEVQNSNQLITSEQISSLLEDNMEALVIRTLPNDISKLSRNYSGIDPPYFEPAGIEKMVELGIEHLLTDLPSVDPEVDEGKLLSHRAFWQYPESTRQGATITELIYVPEEVADGTYLLNLQIANFGIDASPSRPVLYSLEG